MTGPEHYREAEQLAAQAHTVDQEYAMYLVAKAQVHATLALAAATALGTAEVPADGLTAGEWRRTICRPKNVNRGGAA